MPDLYIFKPGAAGVAPTVILGCGNFDALFFKGMPIAVCDGVEVSFPDDESITPAARRLINDWRSALPQTRVPPEDFRYLLVSGLMRSLRPLLRRNDDQNRTTARA